MRCQIGVLQIGGIYHFFSTLTTPQKDKFHVCVGPGQFLLINTAAYQYSIPLQKANYPFLEYNSYICCGTLLEYFDLSEMIESDIKGRLAQDTIRDIIDAVRSAKTLALLDKKSIIANFESLGKQR